VIPEPQRTYILELFAMPISQGRTLEFLPTTALSSTFKGGARLGTTASAAYGDSPPPKRIY
jgi:hypothetical protein